MKQPTKEWVDNLSMVWPDVMNFLRKELKTEKPYIEIDDNVVDFIGAHGRARYYIDKIRSNDDNLIVKKFYGITY